MSTLVIPDTHSLISQLQERDFSKAQAEGIVDALKELDTSAAATKNDLDVAVSDLRLEFSNIKSDLTIRFSALLIGQAVVIVTLIQLTKLVSA